MKTSKVIQMAMTDPSYLNGDAGGVGYLCNIIDDYVVAGKIQPQDANETKARILARLAYCATLRSFLNFTGSLYSIEYRNAAMKFWNKFVRELKREEAKHP